MMRHVDRYYRVKFKDDGSLRDWAAEVVRLALRPLGLKTAGVGDRATIFVPLKRSTGTPVVAYVSEDARVLADGVAPGIELETGVVGLADLPKGLTLLYGDGADAEAYEQRGDR